MLDQIVEKDSRVRLRPQVSLIAGAPKLPDRAMDSVVLQVYDADKMKIQMPEDNGESITLSRDMIYEIEIRVDETIYHGRGRVVDRYRNEEGDVCIFHLLGALALEQEKKFLSVKCEIPADYLIPQGEGAQEGIITSISMDRMIMEAATYIDDGTEVKVTFRPVGGSEMTMSGEVTETIRLRSGKYQSAIGNLRGNIDAEKHLAQWILSAE